MLSIRLPARRALVSAKLALARRARRRARADPRAGVHRHPDLAQQ